MPKHWVLEVQFAAIDRLKDEYSSQIIAQYSRRYAAISAEYEVGLILSSATWRRSKDWGVKLGYSTEELAKAHHRAIELLCEVRVDYENDLNILGGCCGTNHYQIEAIAQRCLERFD